MTDPWTGGPDLDADDEFELIDVKGDGWPVLLRVGSPEHQRALQPIRRGLDSEPPPS